MEEKKISSAVIKRLPRYYRYLSELLEKGIDRISSHELSKKMNVTASQIRQDFNNFGGFGQQGYGYNVSYLHDEIGKILGLEHNYNVIIIGAGNLGQALANYGGFTKRGFQMAGIFDIDPEKIGKKINDIPVYSIEDIEKFVKELACAGNYIQFFLHSSYVITRKSHAESSHRKTDYVLITF